MEDIYSAILGEPTSDREKLMMVADQLRKRQTLGQLGQITGDRVLAPMGAGMVKQATQQAEDIGSRAEQARYRKYQEGASLRTDERERAAQAWRERDAVLERALRRELEAARNATVIEAARIRESGDDKKKYRPMTFKQVQDATNMYLDAQNMGEIVSGFKDEYAGMKVPYARALTNSLAANVPLLTPKSAEKAQNWWATFNQIYTLPERNELFGATLTDNEQAEWKRNAISENMTAEQIRERLNWYETKRREKLPIMARNLKAANYDPELIDTIFSDLVTNPNEEPPIELDENE